MTKTTKLLVKKQVLNITVVCDTQQEMIALLTEAIKDLQDCDKGSITQGENTLSYHISTQDVSVRRKART